MLQLTIQHAIDDTKNLPSDEDLQRWVQASLDKFEPASHELTIRIVDKQEIQTLNREFRKKDKATNVLSFPFEALPDQEINYLGDIAICAPVVMEEANDQGKQPIAHWAHLTIHGVLHLLGYDHEEEREAEEMEALEIEVMKGLGFEDPYFLSS